MYFPEVKSLLLQSAIKYDGKKVKYYRNIFSYLIPVWMLIGFSFCEDLDLELTILNTGQFTLDNWGTLEELWYVDVENTSSQGIDYYLKFTLKKGSDELVIGKTKPLFIEAGNIKSYTNIDPELNTDALADYWEDPDFISNIENTLGYLPPGEYTLELIAKDLQDNPLSSDFEQIEFTFGDHFSIEYPYDGQVIEGANELVFEWHSPGFRQGVQIQFRLIIAAITDGLDAEDAIEYGSSSVYYFDSNWSNIYIAYEPGWPYTETGTSKKLITKYLDLISQTSMDPMVCGYKYAWRMEAREIIDGFQTTIGNQGIWGWPNPIKNGPRSFIWGEIPSGLVSPSGNDVLPTFNWDNLWCADDGFDIQIAPIDDTDFDASWEDYFILPEFQYPVDALSLIPGTSYHWHVRTHSITGATPWSDIATFTIDEIELIEPELGANLESVRPTFNISSPENIGHYKLMISYENDINITLPEVYNAEENITTLPWQYPSQGNEVGLFPGMIYYWKLLMFDNSGNILGREDDYKVWNFRIMPIILSEPSSGATNVSLNPKFVWDSPTSVPKYEFWISDNQDELENPSATIEVIGTQFLEYSDDAELTLEYEKIYYWRVAPKILDTYPLYEPSSSYSDVSQFTTSDFPELGEEVSPSDIDVLIPIIDIETMEGLEYTILIYEDSDGSSIIEEITGITSFPYEYNDGKEKLQHGTTYYIQVQPMKAGEEFGHPSNMMVYSIPEKSDVTQQCEISCELTNNDEPEILTSIITGLADATDYKILYSQNEDMSNLINEMIISADESQYLLTSEYVEWGQTYYTQVIALSEGETLGSPSNIQIVNIVSKPGMNEQTAVSVSLPEGSIIPKFEIINDISGATGYRIIISTETDMSTEMFRFDIPNALAADYPSDGIPLQFGKSYYITAQGLDGDNLHGVISSVIGIFIPNIKLPILGQAFNWEASIPSASQYLLEVSLVEDFSVIIINQSVQGTTYPLNMNELEYSKNYYWRVQGLSNEGTAFGNPSQIKYFKTEAIPEPTLNVISNEGSLTPDFTWAGIDMAVGYQITVASDGGMETILWQENVSSTSIVYPESATQLEFASTYYWQVISLGEDDKHLSQSSIESFSTKSVYPVTGLNPDGGTESLSPTLEWEKNDKISSYLIIIASDAEISNIIVDEQTDGNSIQIEEGKLSLGLNYYWVVDGLDENGESLAGPSKVAFLILPSTSSILLLSPIGGNQATNLNPTLKWGSLEGAEYYNIIISSDSDFGSLIYEDTPSGTEQIIPEENSLINSTTYFWQVEATNAQGEYIQSTKESFSTPATTDINILTLEDGELISITNPVFSWETEENIASFSIRFAKNSEFSESWDFQIGTTNFKYPEEPSLNFNIPYYWQLSPLNNEGSTIGRWTNPRSFSINAAFIVELELPGNGEVATSITPTFKWAVIEGVSKYEIQVSNNEDFSEILWSSAEIVENSTIYPVSGAGELSYGHTYFWHIRAMGEENPLGDFSSIFSFGISGENKVDLEGPLAEESETLFPYFSWITVNGASAYTLTLASEESLSTIIYTAETTEVFIQYPQEAPPLNNGVTYYWNVIAQDKNGSPIGDMSNVGSFSTPSGNIEVEFMFGSE